MNNLANLTKLTQISHTIQYTLLMTLNQDNRQETVHEIDNTPTSETEDEHAPSTLT